MEMQQEIEKSASENIVEQKATMLTPQQLADLLAHHAKDFSHPTIQTAEQLQDEIQTEINQSYPNYNRIIEKLMQLRDAKNNIFWQKIPSPTGNEIIVRNAMQVNSDVKIDKEAFLIQAANYVRAVKAIMGDTFHDKGIFYAVLFKHFMDNMQKANDAKSVEKLFKVYSTVFINTFANHVKLPVDQVIPQLTIARDFCNLEEPTKDIVTLTQLKNKDGKDVTVFQGEIALTKLTDDLVNEYKNRKDKKWYQTLPEWQQGLVELYAERILQSNRVIPTQLRKILVGVRNAFHNVVGVIEDDKALVLNENAHSGTIAYYGKDESENKRIAVLHAKQLKEIANINHLVTLNTPTNVISDDKKIVDESSYAMKQTGGHHSNLPLNWLRRGTISTYIGIINTALDASYLEQVSSELAEEHSEILTKAHRYLKNPTLDDKALLALQTELVLLKDNPNLNNSQKTAVEAMVMQTQLFYLIKNNWNISDPDNRNLSIGALANKIDSSISKLIPRKPRTSSACQSGKDRDGLLIFKINDLSITQYLFNKFLMISKSSLPNKLYLQNLKKLLNAAHTQFMAGYAGGTLGAFGIKNDSIAAIPENEFPKELVSLLVLPTASYNKEIYFDKTLSQIEKIYYASKVQEVDDQIFLIIHALMLQTSCEEARIEKNRSQGFKLLDYFLDIKLNGKELDINIKDPKPKILNDAIKELNGLIDQKATYDEVLKIITKCKKEIEKSVTSLLNNKGPAYQLLETIEIRLGDLAHEKHIESKKKHITFQSS